LSRLAKALQSYYVTPGSQLAAILPAKLDILTENMGLTRKVLRFGLPWAIVQQLLNLWNNQKYTEDDKERDFRWVITYTLGQACLAAYYLADHVWYLGKVRLIDGKAYMDKVKNFGNVVWISKCVFAMIADTIELDIINRKMQKEANNQNNTYKKISHFIQQAMKKQNACVVDLLRNLLDIPVVLHSKLNLSSLL
jgi:hypothetical protein